MERRIYECVFVTSSSLGESGVANLVSNFSAIFAEGGMEVLKQESWGLLELAYKIKDQAKANYFMFVISCTPDALDKFTKKLKYNNLIIRYILQQKKEKDLYLNNEGISLRLPQPFKDRDGFSKNQAV